MADPKNPPGTTPVTADDGTVIAHRIDDLQVFVDALRPVVEANMTETADAETERTGEGWSGSVGGACPVQGDGMVDGLPWYFRARGVSWSFSVAATPEGDPVDALFDNAPEGSWSTSGSAEGEGAFAGSWMPYSEAWRHVEASIAAWRAWRGGARG